ncbi:hypothetical protein GCM10023087_01410 [Microbacterium rhizosphaerae]
MLHHSHLDVGYTHSQPILWRLQSEYLTQVLDWLEDTAGGPAASRPKWTCEVTEPVRRWLLTASADQRDRFVTLAREGRIGFGALRWNTAALTDRTALRRLVDGKRQIEDLTGMPIRVASQHDVNGIPWPLADVLLDAGVELFIMAINTYLGRAVTPRPGAFHWEAPSGRRLRVFNGNHYTMFDQLLNAWDDSVERMQQGWSDYAQHLQRIGYRLPFAYLTTTCSPTLWDNAPPNPFMPELIGRWNASAAAPRLRYATYDDLLENVRDLDQASLPVARGDWTDFWSFGYGSTPIETALNQASKPLLEAAVRLDAQPELLAQATDCVDLYDEHTWSHWDTELSHPQARTQDALKAAVAYEGHELASMAVMDALDRLAENPLADRGMSGILVCNTSDHIREEYVEVPAAWIEPQTTATERTYRASRLMSGNRSWDRRPGEPLRTLGPIRVEAGTWRIIGLDELPSPVSSGSIRTGVGPAVVTYRGVNGDDTDHAESTTGYLESPFHRLTYNLKSGRILSIIDLARDRELLAPRPGIDFLSVVRESPDPLVDPTRLAFHLRDLRREQLDQSNWLDWTRRLDHADRVSGLAVTTSDREVTLVRTLHVRGVPPVTQRIGLSADDPTIHIEVTLDLPNDESPHGLYLALPLALDAGWGAAFDTAGQIVELDRDQLPGSSRGWVTAEAVAMAWDDQSAVALLTPDAPLVQFGGFHFGPPPDAIERTRHPLLLSWISNNYWDTNFPRTQAGRLVLHYRLLTQDRPDHDAVLRRVSDMRTPLLTWPVTTHGRSPSTGPLPGTPTERTIAALEGAGR